MGTIITDAIKAGFALVSDLAENLVNGFTTLLIDSSGTNPTLTAMGWFVLVMFGLGITVGALKLCVAIIRNRG